MAEQSKKVTSMQVARLAGVSQSAVSRTFTPGASVSEKMRRRVLEATRKLGYQPNAIARSLITRRSNMVGIVIANITTNPFYPDVLDALSRRFQERGQRVMLFVVTRDQSLDDILPQLFEYQVDGILITAATLSSEMAQECERLGTPVTLFNRYVLGTSASWVCCDNEEGGRMVARLFLDAGHERPAFLTGSEDTSTSVDRERGFTDYLQEHGVMPLREVGHYTYRWAYEATLRLLDCPERPDAIFCANDIMAIGALEAIRSGRGLRVPEDVSVIGFDDISMAAWPSYNLTTIRQPVVPMMDESVEVLLRRVEDPEAPFVNRLIPGDLVVRGSARLPKGVSSGWVITKEQDHE